MPFSLDENYIIETEAKLNVKFPLEFKTQMMKSNGGELLISEEFEFELYPFFDRTDKKRIARTCNHLLLETNKAREWDGFPDSAIAIGSDGYGNQLILIHDGSGDLTDELHYWNHETKQVYKVAESINRLYLE